MLERTYMLKSANALKVFNLKLIYFTCFTNALQRVTEELRTNFRQVRPIISIKEEPVLTSCDVFGSVSSTIA
ncbi:hypothetical protein ANN_04472 [Periplaneta americana]|uniref:Uncharacterized protein n=1 Tax=Periplaneta americana TaxID=6978 RepID=A0ABQ8TA88_PERAM|nr:hypothetical protein ANN_04472 [Periplaneta americana]